MKRVALLHHDLEWPEKVLGEKLGNQGLDVVCHDVRAASRAVLSRFDLVLNRVYASVANRDYPAVARTIELIEELATSGIRCLNGPKATRSDYDKHYAYRMMQGAGIRTPASERVDFRSADQMTAEILRFGTSVGFPVIVKPNSGGRGRDIFKIDRAEEIAGVAGRAAEKNLQDQLDNAWLIQEFVRSEFAYDCRLSVAAGRCLSAYRRTLLPTNGGAAWLGSRSMGSRCEPYGPARAEMELALAATEAIEAEWNVLDIVLGPKGPVIIENNPTPNFEPGVSDIEGFPLFIEAFVEAASGDSKARGKIFPGAGGRSK